MGGRAAWRAHLMPWRSWLAACGSHVLATCCELQAPADLNGSGPDGKTPGPIADVMWLFVAPDGIQKTLKWIHKRYNG